MPDLIQHNLNQTTRWSQIFRDFEWNLHDNIDLQLLEVNLHVLIESSKWERNWFKRKAFFPWNWKMKLLFIACSPFNWVHSVCTDNMYVPDKSLFASRHIYFEKYSKHNLSNINVFKHWKEHDCFEVGLD